jgi:hypothetical protein
MTAAISGVLLAVAGCGAPADERTEDDRDDVVVDFVDETRAARTVHVSGTVRLTDDGVTQVDPDTGDVMQDRFVGDLPSFEIRAALDFERNAGWATLSAGGTLPFEQRTVFAAGSTYVDAGAFRFTPAAARVEGYEWVRIDDAWGFGTRSFLGGVASNPFDVLDALEDAEVVAGPRSTTIDGTEVTYYEVRLPTDARPLAFAAPTGDRDADRDVEVWVDAAGRLRRSIATFVGFETRYDFTRYGEQVDVAVPGGPGVLDAGEALPPTEPDDHAGEWERLAAGRAGAMTWNVWHAPAGPDWGCWALETDPPGAGSASGSLVPSADFEIPDHDGDPVSCNQEPSERLFAQPVVALTDTAAVAGRHRYFVGVAMDGIESATVGLADGTTSDARVEGDVVSWSGETGASITRVEARLADGRRAVCEPFTLPEVIGEPWEEDVMATLSRPFSCHLREVAG